MEEFQGLGDLSNFSPIPDDWRMYCCDVINSTKAIEAGRYKAVNMAGAACIMAAINAAQGTDIAYVFGGDGATIAVPNSLAASVDVALARTKRMARNAYKLEMRVGAVPVDIIRQHGVDVRVAMLELSPGNRVALFSGGGSQLAEALVKGDKAETYLVTGSSSIPPDLDGLSCRWEPLKARHGQMLCILVTAVADDLRRRATVYHELLKCIESSLSPDWRLAQPVRADNMRFRWPPRGMGLEQQATIGTTPAWKHSMKLYVSSLFQLFAERFDKQVGAYNAPVYRTELRANSDYRRFDDVLRMVIDVTPQQHRAIDELLTASHKKGDISYGTHCSDAALMTCLLFSLEDSRHIHFIDGTEGGFTYAARDMKKRIAAMKGDREKGMVV